MSGFFSSYGFGRGEMPELPVSLLLSAILHLALLLFLSYSPFLKMDSAGQPSFINVDIATISDSAVEPSPPPAAVAKMESKPELKPEPRVKAAPPAPAKDDVVLKKSRAKKEPVKPAPLEKVVEEAKPAPREEAKPAPAQVTSRPVTPTTALPALPEQAGPISALEGARQGVDVSTNYYIQNLVSQISRRWRPPGTLRYDRTAKPVVVYFKVQKDGRITNVSIETSSGRKDLDLSAERAVTETFSIAPLPSNLMQDDTLGVHFKFIPKLAGG